MTTKTTNNRLRLLNTFHRCICHLKDYMLWMNTSVTSHEWTCHKWLKNTRVLPLKCISNLVFTHFRSHEEELLYVALHNIIVEYNSLTGTGQTIDGSVQNIQIDNQLVDAPNDAQVVLYVTPQLKTDETAKLPAIQFRAQRLPSHNYNAHIFKVKTWP